MIKVVYKNDFKLKHKIIENKKNVLRWNSDVKDNYLPIIVISWELIWHLIKAKLKGKLYFFTRSSLEHDKIFYDFFRIKK